MTSSKRPSRKAEQQNRQCDALEASLKDQQASDALPRLITLLQNNDSLDSNSLSWIDSEWAFVCAVKEYSVFFSFQKLLEQKQLMRGAQEEVKMKEEEEEKERKEKEAEREGYKRKEGEQTKWER